MPSISVFAQDVPRAIRERGEEYFRAGRVDIVEQDEFGVTAEVRGSSLYTVQVWWDDEGITEADCDCPFAEERNICKHMWAAVLAADANQSGRGVPKSRSPGVRAKPRVPDWQKELADIRSRMEDAVRQGLIRTAASLGWPADRRIVYVMDLPQTYTWGRGLVLELLTEQQKDGCWGKPKKSQLTRQQWLAVPDDADRQAVQMLLGTGDPWGRYHSSDDARFILGEGTGEMLLRTICQTGRCRVRQLEDQNELEPVAWDDGPPWEFRVRVAPAQNDSRLLSVTGQLVREDEVVPLDTARLFLRSGVMLMHGRMARMDDRGAFDLLVKLRIDGEITVPAEDAWSLVEHLYGLPQPPALELPEELRVEERSATPRPVLKVKAATQSTAADRLTGDLTFDYDGQSVLVGQRGAVLFDRENRRVVRRDLSAETAAWQRLQRVGFRLDWDHSVRQQRPVVAAAKFAKAVHALVAEGWLVEAEGRIFRTPGEFHVSVSSGIDWFELEAKADFGNGVSASLPKLLAALKKGEKTVILDDGSVGVLPEEWLKRYAPLAGFGEAEDGKLRFRATQVAFLDALLASTPEARWDESFDRLRSRLRNFDGVRPAEAPEEFAGELRLYQQEGLGWLHFLREFSFGGCLADDMGLGKTIQVLALLQGRKGHGPSLVVAPRSLVFNWIEEARRFTPDLRVLDHSAAGRKKAHDAFDGYDLVLTTYGTLRRDAAYLKDVRFDYAILDEAQAVKNASTATAKAVRLLQANHRLALSGTPIENHLGELWSLLDFLNPGMLGTAAAFRQWTGGNVGNDPEARAALAKAVRPFVLRRTKKQVAKDLPERTEQTIWCELDADQRKLYDEVRDHYRKALLGRIDSVGMGKAKIQILEALLRLRQAACHPGLIDKKHAGQTSAKLDSLLANLEELLDEGHKVLIFSQFTSFLSLVRERLDAKATVYEYLDGQTTDRQARVQRFQSDPECRLFLISLKAGGVGLNLTAADYVFLLDPWWNPAAEAQAIDRTHRIGQTRSVFAYRLIAKGTVEEKVLELQRTKRDLAEAIIGEDNALLSKLGREDLERLLS